MLFPAILTTLFSISTAYLDYCSISPANTLCKFTPSTVGTSCKTVQLTGVSGADINTILAMHNNLRKRVAQGLEVRGSAGPQPTASNMRQLFWDSELALMAQTHAQQCVFQHDANRNTKNFSYVGQNIAIEMSTVPYKKTNWPAQIQAWYDEVAAFSKSYVYRFPVNPNSGQMIGHYSQLVWAETNRIGCGMARYTGGSYGNNQLYVCNYAPGGNYLNQPVYKVGSPASACPTNTVATDGLCV